ncbi:MAG: hypothetical protein ACE5E6_11240 [Phycisphaerae bacterium]
MVVTSDRTTIKAATQALVAGLRGNLVAEPPTAARPFRGVHDGPLDATGFPRPYLAVWVADAVPVATTDDDKIMRVTTGLTVVTDIVGPDPHDAILDAVGAVDDYLDGIIDAGVIEGAEGFDDRAWTLDYPPTTTGPRVGGAHATATFIVKVQRGQNIVPGT